MRDRIARARAWGRRAGALAWHAGVRRPTVLENVSRSFPRMEAGACRAIARDCYRHFGEEGLLLARMDSGLRVAILDAVEDDADVGARWAELGGGAVVVTGHLGNWELAGAYLAHLGIPVTAVVQPQRGRAGVRLRRLRDALGIRVLVAGSDARHLRSALHAGHAVALVADQHAGAGGLRLPFLGRPAWTTLGPARLASACGVPLVFAALLRDGAGYRTWWRPVFQPGTGADADRSTRAWVGALEAAIRSAPEQYFWFHRRWKSRDRDPVNPERRSTEDV